MSLMATTTTRAHRSVQTKQEQILTRIVAPALGVLGLTLLIALAVLASKESAPEVDAPMWAPVAIEMRCGSDVIDRGSVMGYSGEESATERYYTYRYDLVDGSGTASVTGVYNAEHPGGWPVKVECQEA